MPPASPETPPRPADEPHRDGSRGADSASAIDRETASIVGRFVARDARRSRGWVARGHRYLANERHAAMRSLVARELAGVDHPRILDVGCGGGHDLAAWRADGWPPEALAGIDLVAGRIEAARMAIPEADLRVGTGPDLPHATGSFDVTTAATVFSSIDDLASRKRLFAEMRRVTRPGGIVVVYDFVIRNPRNRSVRAMTPARLAQLSGRRPDGTIRLGPLLYAVGLASAVHPALGRLAARIMPRTHRLSFWRA